MTVIVKIQDTTGAEVGEFQAEDQKSLAEMAAMHGIEIMLSCNSGFCGVCLCDVVEGKDMIDHNKTGETLFDLPKDEKGNPEQVLACVGGIKSEYFTDEKEHTVILKKVY